jgi:hypothetical protein
MTGQPAGWPRGRRPVSAASSLLRRVRYAPSRPSRVGDPLTRDGGRPLAHRLGSDRPWQVGR